MSAWYLPPSRAPGLSCAQSLLDQLGQPLGALRSVAHETQGQASLDRQDLGPQPLGSIPALALAQEPLQPLHGAFQASLLRLPPLSPVVELDQVSHAFELREGV